MKGNLAKGKRKSSDSTAGNHGNLGKRKKESDMFEKDSLFCELVTKSGLTLKTGKKNNELGVDQAIFQRDLKLNLRRQENPTEATEEFIEGLEEYLDEPVRFHWSLLPTTTSADCDSSARGGNLDSFIHLLLGVDSIQSKLMNLLLEKLPEFMGDEDSIFEHGEKINLPRLIMSQFRWLDRIVDSKQLTTKMLEMVTICSLDVQREIITCIPEVVEDSQHGDVAKALRDLLLETTTLTVPILDALSNLTLTPDLLTEVRGSVIGTLASVELDDLPVVTKFLLQSITTTDAVEVIGEMRANLDFHSSLLYNISSNPRDRTQSRSKRANEETSRGSEALTLDAIKSGIRFQKCVAEAWIKTIDGVKLPTNHKVIDIFVLLILHSTNRKKIVESLFRNKIRSGCFAEVLLHATFRSHAQVLRDYFLSILSLAEVLLRSPDLIICYFACAMYKQAFATFDTYCKQEIVGNLVTHIGSGFEGEIDASLDILAQLVDKHRRSMVPFAIFVKGVLDYLDNLSVVQIRKLYSMLCELAFRNPQEDGLIQDDLHIVIRKQLSNNCAKYKRMGVIGAIMSVKNMAYIKGSQGTTRSVDQLEKSALSDDQYKQVVSLLQLVRGSCRKNPSALALFMDELSSVIASGHLDPKVEEWIGENVITDFQDDFVVDIGPDHQPEENLVPIDMLYGLDDETEGMIAINLLPLVILGYTTNHRDDMASETRLPSPVCLAAHFRLLRICEQRQHNNDLEGIDALLGCPVYTIKQGLEEKMESLSALEKDIICSTLFHCLNWFREAVNGFACQTEPEMKAKVISRLQNITEIQPILETCLSAHPGYLPPTAVFDWDEGSTHISPSQSKSTSAGKPRKGGKKKKASPEVPADTTIADEESKDSASQLDTMTSQRGSPTRGTENRPDNNSRLTIDLSLYRQYFRELDMDVFSILNTGFITRAALDTEMNTRATTELKIQPPQLVFLLDDLTRKLHHSLIASASTRRTFLKTRADKKIGFSHLDQHGASEIASKAVQLLPALCQHLESTSGFFQTLIEENDGLIDGPGSTSPEASQMTRCFQLLQQTLLSLFSWNGFLMSDNRPLLQEALTTLVKRIHPSGLSQNSFNELLKNAFEYMENFSGTVPDLASAVSLLKLLICLSEKVEEMDLDGHIAKQSECFLKREWLSSDGEREKGAKHNEHLLIVIKTYLTYSADTLVASEEITTKGVPELIEADKNGCSSTYPTLTRHSFAVFYKVLLTELIQIVKMIQPGKKTDTMEVKLDKLIRWNLAVRIFHVLINLIKVFDSRTNLGSAMKYGRQFVDMFLRLGMPMLDHMFRGHREDVQGLLKNLQLSTRALHHICGHSKIVKDVSLTNQVPMMKRSLEMFVYRVKAMLTVNKCLEAFWLGNLKNRDLQGGEILTQSTVASSMEEESEEEGERETLPEEEEDSDVEMDKQSEGSNESKDGKDGKDGNDGNDGNEEDDSYSLIY